MSENPLSVATNNLSSAFARIVEKYLTPVAEEKGAALADKNREKRFRKQIRMYEKMEEFAAEHNIKLGTTTRKILYPLLQGIEFEDDPTLQEMYARLLAGYLDESKKIVTSVYTSILSQITKSELMIIVGLYENHDRREIKTEMVHRPTGLEFYDSMSSPFDRDYYRKSIGEEADEMLDNLIRLRLINEDYIISTPIIGHAHGADGTTTLYGGPEINPQKSIELSRLGRTLLDICRVKEAPISA